MLRQDILILKTYLQISSALQRQYYPYCYVQEQVDQKERLQLLHAARTVKIDWIKSTCVMLLQEYAALLRVQALEQRLAIVRRELKEGLASEKLAAAAPEPMQEA